MNSQTEYNLPSANEQCITLANLLKPLFSNNNSEKNAVLVGIYSGGAWVVKKIKEILQLPSQSTGFIDVSFYRDDYTKKGLTSSQKIKPTEIPINLENRHVVLLDDVLYTGRTIRAAINEIFDYGRPSKIDIAVLADRGLIYREIPFFANYCTWNFDDKYIQNINKNNQKLKLNKQKINDKIDLSWLIETDNK